MTCAYCREVATHRAVGHDGMSFVVCVLCAEDVQWANAYQPVGEMVAIEPLDGGAA